MSFVFRGARPDLEGGLAGFMPERRSVVCFPYQFLFSFLFVSFSLIKQPVTFELSKISGLLASLERRVCIHLIVPYRYSFRF